jgi:ApbE superfamily uncharacterized protein (UPF0280 family)
MSALLPRAVTHAVEPSADRMVRTGARPTKICPSTAVAGLVAAVATSTMVMLPTS